MRLFKIYDGSQQYCIPTVQLIIYRKINIIRQGGVHVKEKMVFFSCSNSKGHVTPARTYITIKDYLYKWRVKGK